MGAETFVVEATGKSAKEAFNKAVDDAQYNYGHAGYTGTIAEKNDFIMLTPSPALLETLIEPGADFRFNYSTEGELGELWEAVDDKWGPAGCIALPDNRYLFFGWASS